MFESCQCCRPSSPTPCSKIHVLRPIRNATRQRKRLQLYTQGSNAHLPEGREQPLFKKLARPHSQFNIDFLKKQLRQQHPAKFRSTKPPIHHRVSFTEVREERQRAQQTAGSCRLTTKPQIADSQQVLTTEVNSARLTQYESVNKAQADPTTKQSQSISSAKLSGHGLKALMNQHAVELTESCYHHQENSAATQQQAPRMVIEQSIIHMRSVRDNFVQLKLLSESPQKTEIAAFQRNIGLLISLKIYHKSDLRHIVHQQKGHECLHNHPNILRLYRGAVQPNRNYIMIREFYSDTLQSLLNSRITGDIVRDISQQLLSVMVDLTSQRILLSNLSLKDVAFVNGLCKLINFEDWLVVPEGEAEQLNWFYARKLSALLRALLAVPLDSVHFESRSECMDCLAFLQSVDNERLTLRLLQRHPYLSSSRTPV